MDLDQIMERVFEMIPPDWRFRPEDSLTIQKHQDFLLSLTDELIGGFYDTLFAHPTTRAVFREGERPEREESLRRFWLRVAQGPHDADFWKWMVLLGVLHFRRRVKSPMMLAAWTYILSKLRERAREALPPSESKALMEAMTRLATLSQALNVKGYIETFAQASGLSAALQEQIGLTHIVDEEIERLRQQLGRGG